jgi:cell division protein FtsQ
MSFFKKSRTSNRRLNRRNVLDVKLRSDVVRRARIRVLALTAGVVAGTLAVLWGLGAAGHWVMERLVLTNPTFAIRTIDIQTDGVVRKNQLLAWAGVAPGQNLIALDLRRVKRDLELAPIVRRATVDRVLPSTVRIRIEEREPVVRAQALRPGPEGAGLRAAELQLDGSGHVMSPLPPTLTTVPLGDARIRDLPLLVGIKQSDLRPGYRIETASVRAALELVREFSVSPMAGLVELRHIDVSRTDALRVVTTAGSEITFGLRQLGAQLRRWRAIHDYGLMHNRAIAWVDLSVTDNVPARWVAPRPAPAAPSKASRPGSAIRRPNA